MSGLSIGPWALLIGVLGYVLKRWWDSADQIVRERQLAYADYFEASYDLARQLMHVPDAPERPEIKESYDRFQQSLPRFLLTGSPNAIVVSDEFYHRMRRLMDANRAKWSEADKSELISDLSQSLSVLRERLKSEMYLSQPRFLVERAFFVWKWKKAQAGTN